MPMTKIYLRKGSTPEHRRAISDSIHLSLVDVLGISDDDKYHIFHELDDDDLITAPVAFGLDRRPEAIFIQTYFGARPAEVLQQLYRAIVDNLARRTGLGTRDIYINVVESPSANWWADGRRLDPATGFDDRIAPDKVPSKP
jgi:phenylpyruvate tautomerase PptA (4-oxalocrotonate tautomerase family)